MSAPEFDLDDWDFLPPLDLDAVPDEPPHEREHYGAVTIGSELSSVLFAGKPGSAYDLGQAIHHDWASVQPGLAEISRLGATDFSRLDASQRSMRCWRWRSNEPGWIPCNSSCSR